MRIIRTVKQKDLNPFLDSGKNNRQKKEITGIQVRKEKIKLSLLADEIILNTENPKDSTRKPELINKFSKLAG